MFTKQPVTGVCASHRGLPCFLSSRLPPPAPWPSFPQLQAGGYLGLTVPITAALVTLQAILVVGLMSRLADAGPI